MVQQTKLGELPLKRITIKRLKPAKYNPRIVLKPGDAGFEKLVRSIDEFGLVEPIVWNKQTGNVVGGHQRLAVLKYLKVKSTDVVVVDLDKKREMVLNIALNKISGEWDDEKLGIVLEDLRLTDELDELDTGFNVEEIDSIIEDLHEAENKPNESGDGESRVIRQGRAKLVEQCTFRIIIECTGEKHQLQLLKKFEKDKLICRALIS